MGESTEIVRERSRERTREIERARKSTEIDRYIGREIERERERERASQGLPAHETRRDAWRAVTSLGTLLTCVGGSAWSSGHRNYDTLELLRFKPLEKQGLGNKTSRSKQRGLMKSRWRHFVLGCGWD